MSAQSYSVVQSNGGYTVRDSHDRFVAGVYVNEMQALEMCERWNGVAPAPHTGEWWAMYRESNPQLDSASLANIDMLIGRAVA